MRGCAQRLGLPFKVHLERAFFQCIEFFGVQLVVLDHLPQHDVAALGGALGIQHRVVITGALEHANQGRAFQHVELAGRFVKVGLSRHFNAKRVIQKRYGVQVSLKDFVFGVEGLDLQRSDDFLDLARHAARAPDLFRKQVARQLLRDGRAALCIAADGVKNRSGGALQVNAVVLIKAVVFGGYQRSQHVRRDVGQLDAVAVGAFENRQLLAIDRHHHGRLLRLRLQDVPNAGRKGNQQQHIQQQQARQGSQRQQHATPGRVAQVVHGRSRHGLKAGNKAGEKSVHRYTV